MYTEGDDLWTTPNGLSILLSELSERSLLRIKLEAIHGPLVAPGTVQWLRTATLDELEGLDYRQKPPIIEAGFMLQEAMRAKRDAARVKRMNAEGEDF